MLLWHFSWFPGCCRLLQHVHSLHGLSFVYVDCCGPVTLLVPCIILVVMMRTHHAAVKAMLAHLLFTDQRSYMRAHLALDQRAYLAQQAMSK
jgi:hypothetical protein